VLVAVSGGQDSLALLLLLHDLQPKWGWQLGVAHCDHGWRADAAANAAWVMALARELGWPGMERSRLADPQAAHDPPTEAAARAWRYRALAEMAIAGNYPILVTAHTASDRAETLLHHLARGSGSDGLAALTWQRPLTVNLAIPNPTIPNPTTSNTAIPNPTIPNPTIPNPTTSNTVIPNPTTSSPTTSNTAIPNPTIPSPTIPNPTIPNPTTSSPTTSNTAIPNPAIPNPKTFNPAISNPAIPDAAISGVAIADVAIADVAIASPAIPDVAIASSGMRDQTIQLVRPLLDFRRDETAAICDQGGQSPWEDSTNADLHYTRNRLRHSVIPALQAAVNPQVERALARAAEILGDEADCLAAIAQRCLAEAMMVRQGDRASGLDRTSSPDPSSAPQPESPAPDLSSAPDSDSTESEQSRGDRCLSRVDRTVLRRQPIAIQRRALRLWVQEVRAIAPDFATTEKIVCLLRAPNRSQSDPLPGGSWVRVCDQWLELWAPSPS
jgi:tRNA(Ile)-lysidine synthetase-like protein